MRYILIVFFILFSIVPAIAQEATDEILEVAEGAVPDAETVEDVAPPLPDFDLKRQELRDSYLQLKKEMEEDYTVRIKAINPSPTQLELKMEKRELEREFRERKQMILDDYQEQMILLRDEEAGLKGELDRYYYEEPQPETSPLVKPKLNPNPEPKEKAKVGSKRGSRSIPPFSGKSAIGNKPSDKSRGRAGGLLKSRKRRAQLRAKQDAEDDDDDEPKKSPKRGIKRKSMFGTNRR